MSQITGNNEQEVPPDVQERIPLAKPENLPLLHQLQENRYAPKWNYTCGDRLNKKDVAKISVFEEKLYRHRKLRELPPPGHILEWIKDIAPHVPLFRDRLNNLDIRKDFARILPTTREDMAVRLEHCVPDDANLERLIVNPTSGTTGHPIQAPNHPTAIGCYNPMLFYALKRHGVIPPLSENKVVCMLLCAQQETAIYATVKPVLQGAGFAKINIYPHTWRNPDDVILYIQEMKPYFFTGDPFAFSYFLEIMPDYRPAALVSTSIGMPPVLAKKLADNYGCPVIDYYSLNETGPIAYSCPQHEGMFHLLPHDIHIEITDKKGHVLPEGTIGEITVTGGRNPYLPLLRYQTGDRAKLLLSKCSCGDPMPRIIEMQARPLVIFRTPAGAPVNPIDISRFLRLYPILQHSFSQEKDYSCHLRLRLGFGDRLDKEEDLRKQISALFGGKLDLRITYDCTGQAPAWEARCPQPHVSSFHPST